MYFLKYIYNKTIVKNPPMGIMWHFSKLYNKKLIFQNFFYMYLPYCSYLFTYPDKHLNQILPQTLIKTK